jgi:16S rRNA (adenine1518-N6/adenine1519-N6)-dimethyltransferase
LAIDVRERPAVDVEPAAFFKVVTAGFAMPRKQLHNALPQKMWLPAEEVVPTIEAAGIDPMRRAQTLTLDEWATLTREMQRRGHV